MSVASPVTPGASSVGARAAWNVSAEVPEPSTLTATATAATSAAVVAAPARTRRPGARPRRERRCASTRARRAAGASTSSAALRVSATARCCSASRSASSEDAATRASSASRRSGSSDPSASAANSAISRSPSSSARRRLIDTTPRTVTPGAPRRGVGRPALAGLGASVSGATLPTRLAYRRSRRSRRANSGEQLAETSRSEGHHFGACHSRVAGGIHRLRRVRSMPPSLDRVPRVTGCDRRRPATSGMGGPPLVSRADERSPTSRGQS